LTGASKIFGSRNQDPANGSYAPFSQRQLTRLIALTWLVPFISLLAAGFWAWRIDVEEADEHAEKIAALISEHVEHTIDTQVLAIDWINERLRHLSWQEIENSEAVHQLLSELDQRYFESAEIFIVDKMGTLRADSLVFPASSMPAKKSPIHAALQNERIGVVISKDIPAFYSTDPTFAIAKLRQTENSGADGLVGISMRVRFFSEMFQLASIGAEGEVRLSSLNGDLLVTSASIPSEPLSADDLSSLAKSAAPLPLTHKSNRLLTISGYAVRMRNYPLVLSYWIDESVLIQTWIYEFFTYGAVAIASALALTFAAVVAVQSARSESLAIAGWKTEIAKSVATEIETSKLLKFEALGTLAGGIAHYFNNLLPALQGHLDIAETELRAGRPITALISRLSNAVSEARTFLVQILTYSGRTMARYELVDLSTLINQSLDLLMPIAGEHIEIQKIIEPNVLVYGNMVQLRDVTMNIIKNAIEAIGASRGFIECALTVEIGEGSDNLARFSCRDSGAGMTQEVIDRALDPFFTTKSELSSGLGLAISDGVIRSHGGQILIQSKSGSGSTVSFTLPLFTKE
jgi:signal transduction histidine kinase